MRVPSVRVRRAVVDPLWLPAAAVLTALLLLAAVAGLLLLPIDRRGRVPRLALLAALYVVLDAGLVLGCAMLWLRHPVAARRDGERWDQAHAALLRQVLRILRSSAGLLLGFRVRLEEPPDIARLSGGPLLVLARHAGPGDSFTLVELLLSRYQRRPRIVLKETLQWDPGLDVVLSRLSACFLPSHAAGHDLPERLAQLARGLRGSDAMLIFPEGRNWTPRRYHRALARLRRRASRQAAADAADNPNVLPPRPAGVLACLAARPDLDVVVIAHTGLDDLVSAALLWQALPLSRRPMTVRWWYETAASVPAEPAEQYQWLRVQWAIVDSWIGARKAQSGVPVEPVTLGEPVPGEPVPEGEPVRGEPVRGEPVPVGEPVPGEPVPQGEPDVMEQPAVTPEPVLTEEPRLSDGLGLPGLALPDGLGLSDSTGPVLEPPA